MIFVIYGVGVNVIKIENLKFFEKIKLIYVVFINDIYGIVNRIE